MTYFTEKELGCRCGCGLQPKIVTVNILNKIREDYGKPINITSGARCSTYNQKIGGAKASEHTKGNAIDLARTQELLDFLSDKLEHYKICMEDPDSTPSWLHVDLRNRDGWKVFKP